MPSAERIGTVHRNASGRTKAMINYEDELG